MQGRVTQSRLALGVMIWALYAGSSGFQARGSPLPRSDDRHGRNQDHKSQYEQHPDPYDALRRKHQDQLSDWCSSVVRQKAEEQFHTDRLSFSFWHTVSAGEGMAGYHETARGEFRVKEGAHKGEKYPYACVIEGYPPVGTVRIGSLQEQVPIPPELVPTRSQPIPIPRDPVPIPRM